MDRTKIAVTRQLHAMQCNLVEIGICSQHNGKMLNRSCTPGNVIEYLPWLKHANAHAHHIYIRPHNLAKPTGLVLVDDLSEEQIHNLNRDGLCPALVVETSPANYQAWLRFSPPPADHIRTILARGLAKRYLGDINSAHAHHYGRLAGFTNPKPQHLTQSGPPWTLLRVATGRSVLHGAPLIREAHRQAELQCAQTRRPLSEPGETRPQHHHGAARIYQRQLLRLRQRYGAYTDRSRADWVGACALARAGCSQELIQSIIIHLSPALTTRKKGHVLDYAARTDAKAFHAAEATRTK